ncbi:DCC1-like thiol-disulfide oxidoreductase family protein [Nitratireductor sp. XY-223]|uniref:DCC1-like thiol-disulfide oxidoreductase family protein n=1 Tax=Nitratireductor sp. XY-223 TaxID=2561926 RepID=UPI0010AAB3C0|nr:DCC1-like thiol-disulfide oxidoreductase family protein [Nitratireductor sp. XY-223]
MTHTQETKPPAGQATLIYDGDCPFCSRFSDYIRLKKAVGNLVLIDARQGGSAVDDAVARGFDLNEGMVLIVGDNFYHGADCLNRLALMSSRSDLFNRVNYILFRSPLVSRVSYPMLRAGRNLVLRLLGRPMLET